VISRDLRYPPDWPRRSAEEKGIDVALAVDFRAVADPTDYTHALSVSVGLSVLPDPAEVSMPSPAPYLRLLRRANAH